MRKGFDENALGVTGEEEEATLLFNIMLAGADGGGTRFFLAAASRKLTSLGPSSLSDMLGPAGGLKNGLLEHGVKGVVRTNGWVYEGILIEHSSSLSLRIFT